ncbi:MAG: hypothetical protein EX269_09585 [Acidimicrobiales bacterium]|nr:MAG: hypothetical protein EX269_09585 [Acidimicrobiales bacterium]
MRVAFLIEDSLPNGRVGPEHTPHLWRLITEEGGWAPDGGRSVLASSTYPNHASFVTGADVQQHRIFTNDVWDSEQEAFICSAFVGPAIETVFDAARRAGLSTSAILGDQTMVGSMDAPSADVHWPPMGEPPEGAATDSLGYMATSEVIAAADRLDAWAADLVFIHGNEPDSALHLYGPDAPETIDAIHQCDVQLAEMVDRLRPRWDETVVFVVSDHEQEQIDHRFDAIDLGAELDAAGLPGIAHNEGTVGLVIESPGAAAIRRLDPIEDAVDLDEGITLAWSGPGRVFGRRHKSINGQHGSPRTRTQVASVFGGHPVVKTLADELASTTPSATDYAPTMAALLGFDLPHATGRSLLQTS